MGNKGNVFTLVNGIPYAGIEVVLDHPQHPGRRAVWIGEYFIATNFGNQPKYASRTGNTAYLDSIDLEWKERADKTPLPLIIAGTDISPIFLHVSTELATAAKLKERFWQGTIHGGEVIATNHPKNGHYEALIALRNEGDAVDVFCEDGMVYQVKLQGRNLVSTKLHEEEMARLRLNLVIEELATIGENKTLERDARFKQMGYQLHQLVAIGRVAGRRFPEMQEEIFEIFLRCAREGVVTTSVKVHIMEAMDYAPGFIINLDREIETAHARRSSSGAFGKGDSSIVIQLDDHRSHSANTTAQRKRQLAKKQARSAEASAKGASGGQKNKQNRS